MQETVKNPLRPLAPMLRTYPGAIMTYTEIDSAEREQAYKVYRRVPKWALLDILYERLALDLSAGEDYDSFEEAAGDPRVIFHRIWLEYLRIR